MENINQPVIDQVQANINADPPPVVKKTFLKPIYLLIPVFLIIILLLIGFSIFQARSDKQDEVAKDTKVTVFAEEAARKAGYKIYWNGNKNDHTGRNIIADDSRKTSTTHYDSVGLNYPEQYPENIMMALGVFKGWEAIEKSTDVYLLLENPISKNIFKGRVTFEPSTLNSLSGPSGQKNITTVLMVEDLNYGPANEKDWTYDYVSMPFETNDLTIFEKAIKAGDVVAVRTILENEPGYQIVRKDDKEVPVVSKVVIRRFGGAMQLIKELK